MPNRDGKKIICILPLPKPNIVLFAMMALAVGTDTEAGIECHLLGGREDWSVFTYSAVLKHGEKGK